MNSYLQLRRNLVSFLLFSVCTLSWAYDIQVGGIYYYIDDVSATAGVTHDGSHANSYSGNVVIPSSIVYNHKLYTVNYIWADAFRKSTELTSVTIPKSVTTIGIEAFNGCTGLKTVTISEGVTLIDDHAFRDCTSLTSMVIPNSVDSIGYRSFHNCTSLKSISIGKNVNGIAIDAFEGCTGLTKAEFASIENLCKIYFSGSTSNPLYYAQHLYINGHEVTDLVIPSSVTSIGMFTFNNCTSLTSVTIPSSVTSIDRDAFRACIGIKSVFLDVNDFVANATFINNICSVFGSQVEEVLLGNNVNNIGGYTFWQCSSLKKITIPESISTINNYAFQGCTSLEIFNSNIPDIREVTLGQKLFNEISANATLNVHKSQRQYYAKKSQFDVFRFINEKETVKINNISKLSNGKIYRLEPEDAHRGIIFASSDAEYLDACGGTYNNPNVEINDTEPNQQFAIYNHNGQYYLYSIGQHKFVSNYETVGDNVFFKLDSTPKQTITISPSSVDDEFIFIVGDKEWINVTRRTYGCVGNWESEDGGNRISIIEVGDIPFNTLQEIKQALGEPAYILGDANGNGEVEIGDVTSVLTLMATPEATGYDNKAADANKNGEIEIGDVTTILTIMAEGR